MKDRCTTKYLYTKVRKKKSVLIEKLKQFVICSVRYGLGDVVDL